MNWWLRRVVFNYGLRFNRSLRRHLLTCRLKLLFDLERLDFEESHGFLLVAGAKGFDYFPLAHLRTQRGRYGLANPVDAASFREAVIKFCHIVHGPGL